MPTIIAIIVFLGIFGSIFGVLFGNITGNSPISALAGSSFDFDKTIALKIMLSKKKIDFIMSLVQKAQQTQLEK